MGRFDLKKKALFIWLGSILLFVAIGAVPSGLMLVIAPDGSIMQIPVSMLDNAPFGNFLIPGIILMSFHGVLGLIGAFIVYLRKKLSGYIGIFFGSGLIIWIVIQGIMTGFGHFLQIFYLAIGIVELILGILMIRQTSEVGSR